MLSPHRLSPRFQRPRRSLRPPPKHRIDVLSLAASGSWRQLTLSRCITHGRNPPSVIKATLKVKAQPQSAAADSLGQGLSLNLG